MIKKIFVLFSLAVLSSSLLFAKPLAVIPKQEKTIEIVFVIDTTGSMGGLIEGAKTKVWSIINDVMQNQRSAAKVKVGLVAYRDRGDEYVTQVTPLSENLDQIYTTLMGFKAQGGGDTPEDVRMALRDALAQGGWSKPEKNISQIIFLVGDAPSHRDYKDVPDVITTTKAAKAKGIIVNTIQCGSIKGTADEWRTIAQYGGGEYFAIAQTGGVVTINTPYDQELVRLNTQLGKMYVPVGNAAKRQTALSGFVAQESKIKAAPAEAQAARAVNKSMNAYAYSSDDLIQGVENKTIDLKKLKNEELPTNMQSMTDAQKEAYVQELIAERTTLKNKIKDLAKQRDEYIVKQKRESGSQDSFDSAVSRALLKQVK
ncbi:vWA domain-containing protein [Neisseria sp. Ec49-e6-T10]|uniref:vWA domain-containing protein n=1 Tax=Neisseria sp. Ec49-e6-T10 TaxID=3140744 RepID=UPI003EB9C8F9